MIHFIEGGLIFLCGNKGVGKSTVLAYFADGFRKAGRNVYCNFEIGGCEYFDSKQFGKVKFPRGSVIIMDEIALEFNARLFKNFDMKITKFLKKQRHHGNMVIVASQTFNDTDKNFRDSADMVYYLTKYGQFTIARQIVNKLVLVPSQNGNSGYMGFDLYFAGLLQKNALIILYRPFYYHLFNSWVLDDDDDMPLVESSIIPYVSRKQYRKNKRKNKKKHV